LLHKARVDRGLFWLQSHHEYRYFPYRRHRHRPGRGGIGVVRASGKNLQGLVTALFGTTKLQPRHATYLPFRQADGSIIDQGIAIFFPGPHSYTGEDVLELQGHGGPIVLQLLLARVLEAGAELGLRLAEPGEFTAAPTSTTSSTWPRPKRWPT
jgi:tRNA U34 5-carboxymethylaminomethyl modifying GTPase MnmE/TrmE